MKTGARYDGIADWYDTEFQRGLRIRVGASHLPLALFLQTFLDAGLVLERIEEPEEREYPFILALRWRR